MRSGKIFVLICLVTFAAVFACGQNESASTAAEIDQQQEGQAADLASDTASTGKGQAPVQQVEIAGTVEETADGLVIRSVNDSYMVAGSDLTQMIGQDVRVTGTLEESNGKPTIHIESINVIE